MGEMVKAAQPSGTWSVLQATDERVDARQVEDEGGKVDSPQRGRGISPPTAPPAVVEAVRQFGSVNAAQDGRQFGDSRRQVRYTPGRGCVRLLPH